MSVDLFLYTEKKLPRKHALLLACGFEEEDGEYTFDTEQDLVSISCESIDEADCFEDTLTAVKKLVPTVKYQIHINFAGGLSDKVFNDASVYTMALIKELNGVLDTDGTLEAFDGRKTYYKVENYEIKFSDKPFGEQFNIDSQKMLRKSKILSLLAAIIGVLCLVPVIVAIVFWSLDNGLAGVISILMIFPVTFVSLGLFKIAERCKRIGETVQSYNSAVLPDGVVEKLSQEWLDMGDESSLEFSGDIDGMNLVDWECSDEQAAELNAHLEEFFATVQYPKSFVEFVKFYDNMMQQGSYDLPSSVKQYVTIDLEGEAVQVGVSSLQKFDELAEFNKDYRYINDVLPAFRDVVFFAFGESGHEDFFLDFSQDKNTPSVKLLEDYHITKLADSFDEFLQKLDFYKDDESEDDSGERETNTIHLTFKDEKSDKFWTINYIGEHYFVHYGRNGTMGRLEIKECGNDEETKNFVTKTIAEKKRKGYVVASVAKNDKFEKHKLTVSDVINSIYQMFGDEVPHIYMSAVRTACEKYCDLLREAAGNKTKIISSAKSLALVLNQLNEEYGFIETDEREMLCEFIDKGAELAGYEDADDIAGEWREW
ncbi:MAG: WGR domain-containing protein [Firmicutes bacterium]|nr:WGR domain-containing protein [Bacillota bacterium]